MKKAIAIFVLAAIVVYLSANFVYAMAKVNNLPQPKTYIAAVAGDVQIKHSQTSGWLSAKVNDELKSDDEIKTGGDGKVSIVFFDNSIAHIGAESEVKLSELSIDQKDFGKTKVKLTVQIGRIWSRIMQLSDRESTYEVGSSNTVATVRGTVFDFLVSPDDTTKVSSIENFVEVSSVKTTEEVDEKTGRKKVVQQVVKTVNVLPDEVAKIERSTSTDEVTAPVISPLPAEEKNSSWFQSNALEDKKIESEIKKKQEEANKAAAGVLPDENFYSLKQLAEKARLALAGDSAAKKELEASFLARRLAEAQALMEIGKVELAARIIQENGEFLQWFAGEIDQLGDDRKNQLKAILKNQMELQRNLMGQITLGQPAYQIKKLMEEMQVKITPESEQDFLLYRQAKERLREAQLLLDRGENDLYKKTLDEHQALVKILEKNQAGDYMYRLNIMMNQLKKAQDRAEGKTAPESPVEPAIERGQIKEEKPSAEQPPTIEPPKESAISQPAVEPVKPTLTKLTITAGKYNIIAPGSQQMTATAVYSDGSTKDVTSLAKWSLSGDIGSISSGGLLQSDGDGGLGTASASYSEDGVTVTGSSQTFTALTVER